MGGGTTSSLVLNLELTALKYVLLQYASIFAVYVHMTPCVRLLILVPLVPLLVCRAQVEALQVENEDLRAELDALDPSFFEEIEDLKVQVPLDHPKGPAPVCGSKM
jgi:hypothetical protein